MMVERAINLSTIYVVPKNYTSFKKMEVKLTFNAQKMKLTVIYQPGHTASDVSFLASLGHFWRVSI